MGYREKTAWLMLVLLALTAGWYLSLLHGLGGGQPPAIGTVLGAIVALTVASVAGNVVLALSARDEAREPADERERLVALKAGYWAHMTLITGLVMALGWFVANGSGAQLFHFAFASLLVAQTVDYAMQVVLLRRGF